MIIGILKIELFLSESHSLKDKRRILKSLKDTIRNKFNISICEIDNHDKWQRAKLGVVNVALSSEMIHSVLAKIIELIGQVKTVELIDYNTEML